MKRYYITIVTLALFCFSLLPTFLFADLFCQVGENGVRTTTPFVDVQVGENGVRTSMPFIDIEVGENGVSVTKEKRSSSDKLGIFIGAVTGAIVGTTLLPAAPVFGAIFGGLFGASLVSWLKSFNDRNDYTKSSDKACISVGPFKTVSNGATTSISMDEAYQRVLKAENREQYLQALKDYQAACILRQEAIESAMGQTQ